MTASEDALSTPAGETYRAIDPCTCGHDPAHHGKQELMGLPWHPDCQWRGCGCPFFVPAERATAHETITLRLTKYERDNLLAALTAASGYTGQRSPLQALNNGDWLMQVLHKLGFLGMEKTDFGRPNVLAVEIAKVANAEQWRAS